MLDGVRPRISADLRPNRPARYLLAHDILLYPSVVFCCANRRHPQQPSQPPVDARTISDGPKRAVVHHLAQCNGGRRGGRALAIVSTAGRAARQFEPRLAKRANVLHWMDARLSPRLLRPSRRCAGSVRCRERCSHCGPRIQLQRVVLAQQLWKQWRLPERIGLGTWRPRRIRLVGIRSASFWVTETNCNWEGSGFPGAVETCLRASGRQPSTHGRGSIATMNELDEISTYSWWTLSGSYPAGSRRHNVQIADADGCLLAPGQALVAANGGDPSLGCSTSCRPPPPPPPFQCPDVASLPTGCELNASQSTSACACEYVWNDSCAAPTSVRLVCEDDG